LQIRTALKKYKEALIKKLNGYYLKRSKRYGQRLMKPLHIDNIKTILGSPEVSEGKLFYTFYVESGECSMDHAAANSFFLSV